MQKRFLFVGHGIDKDNWGNRGTSLALLNLVEERGAASDYVWSREKGKKLGSRLVARVASKLAWELYQYRQINQKGRLSNIAAGLALEFARVGEFIEDAPEKSAERILIDRKKHTFLDSLVSRVESVDAVVVNGEGDMIFTSPPRRTFLFLMALVALSLKLGKEVFFVNTIASASPNGTVDVATVEQARELLGRCAAVSVRDPQSLDFIKQYMPGISAEYIPDALFLWRLRYFDKMDTAAVFQYLLPYFERTPLMSLAELSRPYVVVAGSSRISSSKGDAIKSYSALIKGVQALGFGVVACQPGPGDEFLKQAASETNSSYVSANVPIMAGAALLAGARAFISGRYHPSILASNGGTPCVFLGSNSHKTSSLQQVLGYDKVREYGCPPAATEIEEILNQVKIVAHDGELRSRIYKQAAVCAQDVVSFYGRIF